MCSTVLYLFICGSVAVLTPDAEETFFYGALYNWTFYCLFSLVQILLTGGVTLGHAICRMTLVSDVAARTSKRRRLAGLLSAGRSAAGQVTVGRKSSKQIQNGRASAGQLIKRYLYLWLFTELPLVIVALIAEGRFGFLSDFMIIGLLLLSRAYFVAYFIFEVFRKEAIPMPHDRLSGTTYRSLNSILS